MDQFTAGWAIDGPVYSWMGCNGWAIDRIQEQKVLTDQFEDFTAKAPTLVFDEAPKAPEQKPEPEKEKRWNESLLSPEEKQQADAFAAQIDLHNSAAILHYGVGTQKKLADFSERALNNVRTKDMGEVGNMIAGLVMELKSFDNLQQAKDLVRGLRDIMFYMETAEQDRLIPVTILAPSEAVLEKVYSLLEGMEEEK